MIVQSSYSTEVLMPYSEVPCSHMRNSSHKVFHPATIPQIDQIYELRDGPRYKMLRFRSETYGVVASGADKRLPTFNADKC